MLDDREWTRPFDVSVRLARCALFEYRTNAIQRVTARMNKEKPLHFSNE